MLSCYVHGAGLPYLLPGDRRLAGGGRWHSTAPVCCAPLLLAGRQCLFTSTVLVVTVPLQHRSVGLLL